MGCVGYIYRYIYQLDYELKISIAWHVQLTRMCPESIVRHKKSGAKKYIILLFKFKSSGVVQNFIQLVFTDTSKNKEAGIGKNCWATHYTYLQQT